MLVIIEVSQSSTRTLQRKTNDEHCSLENSQNETQMNRKKQLAKISCEWLCIQYEMLRGERMGWWLLVATDCFNYRSNGCSVCAYLSRLQWRSYIHSRDVADYSKPYCRN